MSYANHAVTTDPVTGIVTFGRGHSWTIDVSSIVVSQADYIDGVLVTTYSDACRELARIERTLAERYGITRHVRRWLMQAEHNGKIDEDRDPDVCVWQHAFAVWASYERYAGRTVVNYARRAAVVTFKRTMRRLMRSARVLHVPVGTIHRTYEANGDPDRCNCAFVAWAKQERRWADKHWGVEDRVVQRRRAHLYESAARAVARLRATVAT